MKEQIEEEETDDETIKQASGIEAYVREQDKKLKA
jgi:hypothetical protein